MRIEVIHGEAKEELAEFDDNSIDALLTDPPAGIAFMNKGWDKDKGGRDAWVAEMASIFKECLRVMKPGAHGLVWALPRTSHWTATALEDAGFEVRDVIMHLFGSGFPKNMDVSKAIDKAAGAERKVVGISNRGSGASPQKLLNHDTGDTGIGILDGSGKRFDITAPATDEAKQWEGWGTALKPACEHWILVRKPVSEKTVAANVLKYGTGAINIDDSRIPSDTPIKAGLSDPANRKGIVGTDLGISHADKEKFQQAQRQSLERANAMGRWPAHLVLTEGEATEILDSQYEGASRFFYCAKPSGKEKNGGLEDFEPKQVNDGRETSIDNPYQRGDSLRKNTHPTVKPVKLMEYFATLITPPGGVILDPFMGSGTTGVAAVNLGFGFVGIDMTEEYVDIAEARVREAYRGRKKQAA